MCEFCNPGKLVSVIDSDTGREVFKAHLSDLKPPWMFWTRVIPLSDHIDLPPKYKVVALED